MFMYFPGNYMWSAAVLRCLNAGGVIGEVDRACSQLIEASTRPPAGDLEAWHREWYRLAAQVEEIAEAALRNGRIATARSHYIRASHYYQWSESFFPLSDPRKRPTYLKRIHCFRQALELTPQPIELVDVPYEGGPLPGYFLSPVPAPPAPWPAVVFFDGLGIGDKEEYLPCAMAIAERGVACLIVDGPGMGEALRLRGIVSRFDYEVPATAMYEYVAARENVDPNRVGLMALSLGGYYAPRAVAFEKRYKACAAWAGVYDYHEAQLRRLNMQPGTPTAAPPHGLFDHIGVDTMEEALERLKAFSMRGIAEQIECDFLVVHGEDDRQTLVAQALALYEAAGSKRKDLKIYTRAEGGASHCQIDCVEPARAFIADWLAEHL